MNLRLCQPPTYKANIQYRVRIPHLASTRSKNTFTVEGLSRFARNCRSATRTFVLLSTTLPTTTNDIKKKDTP